MLPFSAAADRNKEVILAKLQSVFADRTRVLEIGSGNGQHAVHVTAALPRLTWQCSDLAENLPGIAARLDQDGNDRTPPPLALDVSTGPWPLPDPDSKAAFDAVFTANTLHIMSFDHVIALFARVGETLRAENAVLCVYGPLKYEGAFTTPSNEAFDTQLKTWNPDSGIRDFETLDKLAAKEGLRFIADHPMPANNQLVVWRR